LTPGAAHLPNDSRAQETIISMTELHVGTCCYSKKGCIGSSICIAVPRLVDGTKAGSSISFKARKGGSCVLLGCSSLVKSSLRLTSLLGLLLRSRHFSMADLLGLASSLCSSLVQGLGVCSSSHGSFAFRIPQAVLLKSAGMDLLGRCSPAGLLGGLRSPDLSCALVLHQLLRGLSLRGF